MNSKRWVILIVLILLIGGAVTTCFRKEKKPEVLPSAAPVAESKVEAIPLEQNKMFVPTTPDWQKNKDPWYEQATKTSKPEEPGDEENKQDELSLM